MPECWNCNSYVAVVSSSPDCRDTWSWWKQPVKKRFERFVGALTTNMSTLLGAVFRPAVGRQSGRSVSYWYLIDSSSIINNPWGCSRYNAETKTIGSRCVGPATTSPAVCLTIKVANDLLASSYYFCLTRSKMFELLLESRVVNDKDGATMVEWSWDSSSLTVGELGICPCSFFTASCSSRLISLLLSAV